MAQSGARLWNFWQSNWRLRAGITIDFSGQDFSQLSPAVSFEGFELKYDANFSDARFSTGTSFSNTKASGSLCFDGAHFASGAAFEKATFEGPVSFGGATFEDVVSFEGAAFQAVTSFDGASFTGSASFKGCRFGHTTSFSQARFGERATFANASFPKGGSFKGAEFGNETSFESAIFEQAAHFLGTCFGERCVFKQVQFHAGADFTGAVIALGFDFQQAHLSELSFVRADLAGGTFESATFRQPNFTAAHFGPDVTFAKATFYLLVSAQGAAFGDRVSFDGAIFVDRTSFAALSFGKDASFVGTIFQKPVTFERTNFAGDVSFRKGQFADVFFNGAYFGGTARFTGRSFTAKTSFRESVVDGNVRNTVFADAPDFHDCKLHQDTDFHHADFRGLDRPEAALCYRTLKLAMSQHQAVREERQFFRLEMIAEAAQERRRAVKALYRLYGVLADYGLSVGRPLLWLFLATVVFAPFYARAAGLTLCVPWMCETNWRTPGQWLEYVVLSALPVPGMEKTLVTLWGELSTSGEGAVGLLLPVTQFLHRSLSLVCFFFVGLGLRNTFKLK